ncbi:MAG: 2-C-methyl-D-erythritol 4-phosphate cytidylyltransferase [Vampirovibrionales bacterium]
MLLCAAGESRRFYESWKHTFPEAPMPWHTKLLAPLETLQNVQEPVIAYSLKAVAASLHAMPLPLAQEEDGQPTFFDCEGVCVVAPTRDWETFQTLAQRYLPNVPIWFTEGGDTRQGSVWNGLQTLQTVLPTTEATRYVVVHDAARPLVTASMVHDCLMTLTAHADLHACCVGHPATDTLKQVISYPEHPTQAPLPSITQTPSRESLWQVQTPQVFQWETLWQAHLRASQLGDTASTDDMHVVERYCPERKQCIVPQRLPNPKITYAHDWLVCQALLRLSSE